MIQEAKVATNPNEIKIWVEARNGRYASVKSTEQKGKEAGIFRIDFSGYIGEDILERISLGEFFRKFEESNLAFLYQDELKDDGESRFFKLVDRNSTGNK